MAYEDYDTYNAGYNPMGDYTGYDTSAPVDPEELRKRHEEELKRAEEAAGQVVNQQTVETRADGTQSVTTKTEKPAPVAPQAPQSFMPGETGGMPEQQPGLNLNDIFKRMVGAESNGQHYDQSGKILTSPKGAVGIAQIMPATAANPGYGIKPATPEEIATPEGNFNFGQRLFHGINKAFGGDVMKSVAAYNAGPGKIQAAEKQAQMQGGSWADYIPKETLNYIGKVFNNMIPSAQAGTLPQGKPGTIPVAPTAQAQPVNPNSTKAELQSVTPQPQIEQATNQPNSYDEFGTPVYSPQVAQLNRNVADFSAAQGSVEKLMSLGNNQEAPEWMRKQAKSDAADLLIQDREKQKAEQQLTKMTPQQISKEMTKPSEEGSWAKYLLFGALGMTALRDDEAAKLGIGNKWSAGMDDKGNPAMIQYDVRGLPKAGIDSQGQPIPQKDIMNYVNGGGKWQTSAEFFQDKAGNSYQAQHNEKGQTRIVNVKTGAPYRGEESLTRLRDVAATEKLTQQQQYRRENMATSLRNQMTTVKAKDRLSVFSDYNKALVAENLPTLTMAEMGLRPDGTLMSERPNEPVAPTAAAPQTMPTVQTGGAPAPQAAGPVAPGAPSMPTPAAQPGMAATPGVRPTLEEIKRKQEEEKTAREVAATGAKEESKKLADMRVALPKVERGTEATLKTIDDLLKHPGFSDVIGVPNVITGIWSPPGTDARDFKQKYEQVKGKAFMEAYNNLRGTGSISEKEGMRAEASIAAMNDPHVSEKEFIRNANIFKETLRNGIDNERIQLGQEPRYKKFSTQEREAFAWLKKNPTDPRADAVRLKLERTGE